MLYIDRHQTKSTILHLILLEWLLNEHCCMNINTFTPVQITRKRAPFCLISKTCWIPLSSIIAHGHCFITILRIWCVSLKKKHLKTLSLYTSRISNYEEKASLVKSFKLIVLIYQRQTYFQDYISIFKEYKIYCLFNKCGYRKCETNWFCWKKTLIKSLLKSHNLTNILYTFKKLRTKRSFPESNNL